MIKSRLEELAEIEALANEIEAKLTTAKAGLKYCKVRVRELGALCKVARKGQVKA